MNLLEEVAVQLHRAKWITLDTAAHLITRDKATGLDDEDFTKPNPVLAWYAARGYTRYRVGGGRESVPLLMLRTINPFFCRLCPRTQTVDCAPRFCGNKHDRRALLIRRPATHCWRCCYAIGRLLVHPLRARLSDSR